MLEARLIHTLLDPSQGCQPSVRRVGLPALMADLGLGERAALTRAIAPDRVPVEQEGPRQTEIGARRSGAGWDRLP